MVEHEINSENNSSLVTKNVIIGGKRTSTRLEPDFWAGLFDIARREGLDTHDLCTLIAQNKSEQTPLATALRVFVVAYFRAAATEEGHARAGHGYGKITPPPVRDMPKKLSLKNGTHGIPIR